jgi:energy-coupling factor transporter transmembrane protein EcfT
MDREIFWNGFYVYIIIQGMIIVIRLLKLIEVSWWLVFIPTFVILLGGFVFLIYFGLTCNPRIEKQECD